MLSNLDEERESKKRPYSDYHNRLFDSLESLCPEQRARIRAEQHPRLRQCAGHLDVSAVVAELGLEPLARRGPKKGDLLVGENDAKGK